MENKSIPWSKIKASYLEGATPKELSLKYRIDVELIYNKIKGGKWTTKKSEIIRKTEEKISEEIITAGITNTQRQLDLADSLAKKIELALTEPNIKVTELKAIASSLLDLQKIERTAEGLDKDQSQSSESSREDFLNALRQLKA